MFFSLGLQGSRSVNDTKLFLNSKHKVTLINHKCENFRFQQRVEGE